MPVILATWEAEIRGSQLKANLNKKLARYHHLNQWLDAMVHMPVVKDHGPGWA
jgi:hypothetical protein